MLYDENFFKIILICLFIYGVDYEFINQKRLTISKN